MKNTQSNLTRGLALLSALCIAFFQFPGCQPNDESHTTYCWKWKSGDTIATIQVPVGFHLLSEWEYGEGKVTTLRWADSSTVVLHFGGLMHLPFLGPPRYILTDSTTDRDGYTLKGRVVGTDLWWREVQLHEGWYNIAYYDVPPDRVKLFDTMFESFKPKDVPVPSN